MNEQFFELMTFKMKRPLTVGKACEYYRSVRESIHVVRAVKFCCIYVERKRKAYLVTVFENPPYLYKAVFFKYGNVRDLAIYGKFRLPIKPLRKS